MFQRTILLLPLYSNIKQPIMKTYFLPFYAWAFQGVQPKKGTRLRPLPRPRPRPPLPFRFCWYICCRFLFCEYLIPNRMCIWFGGISIVLPRFPAVLICWHSSNSFFSSSFPKFSFINSSWQTSFSRAISGSSFFSNRIWLTWAGVMSTPSPNNFSIVSNSGWVEVDR